MSEADAAVAIVHTDRLPESVLLMRRTERENDPWSGHWSFPGGRREPEDHELLCTALRELEEECGVRLGREHLEAALPVTLARRRVGRFLVVAPFVFLVESELPAEPHLEEAVEARWVPLNILRDPARHALRRVPGLPPEVLFPAIDLNAVPLWGFTYRLITEWLGLVPKDAPFEQAGFGSARALLEFLLARGLRLAHGWIDGENTKIAAVKGTIPVEDVLAHASAPTLHIPHLNRLEVRSDSVRVTGLAFEEYLIRAAG